MRLSFAAAGAGNLTGQEPPPGNGAETFRFGYGEGDELERIVRESTSQIASFETGAYDRIVSRNGAPFAYDKVGRRLDDDRFVYRWDWRGQLVSATVKDTWSDSDGDGAPDVTPFAGHQVRYEYDAAGRLTHRWHYGKLPEGATDDAQRPFIEKRVFVWEGNALAAEAAYNQDEALRWRKTYVPGPSGLDDAVQVVVEDAASATARTYTLLRDELGTVLGLVAEDEGSDPANPPVPVRYRYTPYGEAHAESGPELLRARFDGQAIEVQTDSGTTTQAVSNETTAAAGSLVLDWSLSLDPATLPANLLVERLAPGTGWAALSPEEVAVGPEPADGGISAGGGGPPARLLVLTRTGWLRGTSYRVRLTSGLTDDLGRRFGRTETLEWRVPEAWTTSATSTHPFDQKTAPRFESWEAAKDDLGGRFPGGQTALFQGLWTDPVTGAAYARARWYDARNASWLSEDPLLDVDSANLYAFVAWAPQQAVDPMGTSVVGKVIKKLSKGAVEEVVRRRVRTAVYRAVRRELAQRGWRGLYQIQHIVPQSFYKEFGSFFDEIGFQVDSTKNLITLPTTETKQLGRLGSNRTAHQGWTTAHADYNRQLQEQVGTLREAYTRGDLSKDEALEHLRQMQVQLRADLRQGKIQLTDEQVNALTGNGTGAAVALSFGIVGFTATSAEAIAEQRTDLVVQEAMTRERAKNAYVKYGTAGYYVADEGIQHWIGFGIDLVNPIADVQDISDLLEDLSGYDWVTMTPLAPPEPTPSVVPAPSATPETP